MPRDCTKYLASGVVGPGGLSVLKNSPSSVSEAVARLHPNHVARKSYSNLGVEAHSSPDMTADVPFFNRLGWYRNRFQGRVSHRTGIDPVG
jgi:hypothetical protein